MEELMLTVEQLALRIHKTPGTIRYDLSRHPERLPPAFRLPGSRKPLWHPKTVRQFLLDCAARHNALPKTPARKKR